MTMSKKCPYLSSISRAFSIMSFSSSSCNNKNYFVSEVNSSCKRSLSINLIYQNIIITKNQLLCKLLRMLSSSAEASQDSAARQRQRMASNQKCAVFSNSADVDSVRKFYHYSLLNEWHLVTFRNTPFRIPHVLQIF